MISGQDWPLRSADKIVKFFEEHNGTNFVQYWNSKNHGSHQQNNLDKRNQIYFPIKLIGRKPWQKIIKRGWVEFTGGYNQTWKIFERKQLGIEFYFGSSWWALKRETIDWIMQYITTHPEYYKFYENATCPDESFFQTLVMISPYADENTDYLTYLHFQKGANSPDILTEDNLQRARESKYLIMRKVDMNVDDSFLQI
ncbi:MAG: beta-1,6-N-acetylglucosaminyltransferase [Faecalibacterium sp.]